MYGLLGMYGYGFCEVKIIYGYKIMYSYKIMYGFIYCKFGD